MFAKRTNWNLEVNRLSAALAAHRAAGKPLIDMTASNPTECGFQYDEEAILNALRNPEALNYEPNPRGLEVARSAVAKYYAEHGAAISIEDIFLTTSTSEAYSYVFRTLCDPEDELLIPEPSYPLFEFLADIQDVRLARYPLVYDYGWQIDFHALENAITPRTRGVIVVHPNNPTGHFCKPGEMRKLNEICARREIAIIADEVFLDFALKRNTAGHVCGECWSADVYDERVIEDLRSATNEGSVADRERARSAQTRSARAPRSDCGYLPLDERPDSVGDASAIEAAGGVPKPSAGARSRESFRTRQAVSCAEILQPTRSGGWVERGDPSAS